MELLRLMLVFVVGAAGGILAMRKKVPAGAMIGAMLSVALLSVCIGDLYYPPDFRVLVQTLSGTVIGAGFSREDVVQLRSMAKPAVLLSVILMGFTLLFALLVSKVNDQINLMTALFSCAPGGVSDMALISVDFGANPEIVSILQLVRFVFVLSFFPQFLKRRYLDGKPALASHEPTAAAAQAAKSLSLQQKGLRMAGSFLVGISCGYLFRWAGIPAGAIVGGIIGVMSANLLTDKVYIHKKVRAGVQICAGCYIGTQITRGAVFSLQTLLIPMVLVLMGVLAMSFLGAWVIHKATGLEYVTALFSCTPGGIAEMGLIAQDMGLDTPKIVVMHTVRVLVTICLFPSVVQLLT